MASEVAERRQQRRVNLEGRIEVREVTPAGKPCEPISGRATNISLAGCYAIMRAPFPLSAGAAIMCSVDISPSAAKQFPFVRLVGKGRIVRVSHLRQRVRRSTDVTQAEGPDEVKPAEGADIGVAIALGQDVTALTTISSF